MSEQDVKAAALVPQDNGMVLKLRFNQVTGRAELFFGIRTPTQEVAFGLSYWEMEELVRTMTHLMAQVPDSKRGPKG